MNKEEIKTLREQYPEGSRVRLIHMTDPTAPPEGTIGTVTFIDSIGSIGVDWDNGSGLNVVPDAGDQIESLVPDFTDTVRREIMNIRDSGKVNMLLVNDVQWLANREHYYDLVVFLIDHKKEYTHFIMAGKIC